MTFFNTKFNNFPLCESLGNCSPPAIKASLVTKEEYIQLNVYVELTVIITIDNLTDRQNIPNNKIVNCKNMKSENMTIFN